MPTFSLSVEPLHLDRAHARRRGVLAEIDHLSLTVKAIGDVAARLTALALNAKRFDVTLQELTGNDWSFRSIVLSECLITSASPSSASPSGAPTATFSGFSMHAASDGKKACAAIP